MTNRKGTIRRALWDAAGLGLAFIAAWACTWGLAAMMWNPV